MNRTEIQEHHTADPDSYAPWLLAEGTAVWVEDHTGDLMFAHIIFDTDFAMHADWGHYTVAYPNTSKQGYGTSTYRREDIIPAGKAG